jgi:dTDP-4-amino-4,6-dideoxygalactose transaminase
MHFIGGKDVNISELIHFIKITISTYMFTSAYEQLFARLLAVDYAITFGYARHALISILTAAGLQPGDEIILSPLTCKVVPLALLSLRLKPVYVDISAETLNLNPRGVQPAIGSSIRAVLFQHTYGNSAGVEAVAKFAAEKKVAMFEDCAQCLPVAENQFTESWDRAAIFSNNLLKPLPAASGGVAVTNDSGLAWKIREARDRLPPHGKFAEMMLHMEIWVHKHVLRPALYWPLFALNAKIDSSYKVQPVEVEIANEISRKAHRVSHYQMREGIRWLRKVESIANHRRLCCAEYTRALSGVKDLGLPAAGTSQPLYYFPVVVQNKESLLREARKKRIELVAWPIKTPIYPLERKQDLLAYGYEPGTCPIAEEVATRLIGLPTHNKITAEIRDRIADLLLNHNG